MDAYFSLILGQQVKTKWLTLGTLAATIGGSVFAMSGDSKPKQEGSTGKQTLEQVKDAVTFKSSSSCVPFPLGSLQHALFVYHEAEFCSRFLSLLLWRR